jgi:tetratricopeptide (TPR) repeat protein
MGHYPEAMEAARRCAELGEARMAAEPERFEQHREGALNGYLLLHDAAKAAGKRDEAAEAMEHGGLLIDKSREPVFWADYLQPLAEFHLEHAHWDRAEGLIDEIIDIREEHQPEQTAQAKSLLLWCNLLYSKADYSGMASVAARAERIFDEQVPPDLGGVAAALNSRAIALIKLGYFAEAEPVCRRGLAVFESAYGADYPYVADFLNNLAALLADTGRRAEAEPLYRRALAIKESAYGPDHPGLATGLNNLAELLMLTGRLAEAEPLLRRALAILLRFTQATALEHPNLQAAIVNYVDLLNAMGHDEAAIRARLDEIGQPFGISLGQYL